MIKLNIQMFGGRGAKSSKVDYRNTYSAKEISKFSNKRLNDEIQGTTKEYEKAVNTRNIFDGRTYNGRMERTYNRAQVSKLRNKLELLQNEKTTREIDKEYKKAFKNGDLPF